MTNETTATRRDILKGAGAIAAAGIAAGAMPLTHAVAAEEATDAEGNLTVPSFLVKPEPITEFAETHEFDVVVVGAGEAAETTAAALAETRQVPAVRSRAAGNAGKRNCLRRATASWGAAFRAARPRSCERSHRRWGSLSWKVCCSARRSVSSRAAIISFPC